MMTKQWFMLIVILFSKFFFESTPAFSDGMTEQGWINVEIVNYVQVAKYRINGENSPILLSTSPRTADSQDSLGQISMSISATRRARAYEATLLSAQYGRNIKWANSSPDKRFVLVGFEDPSIESMTTANLIRISDFSVILQVKSEGIIRDSLWSPDSKSLAILESTERMSKTPWGLFAAISGHPIELQTFYVRFLDLAPPYNEKRVKVATDIENASAELHLH